MGVQLAGERGRYHERGPEMGSCSGPVGMSGRGSRLVRMRGRGSYQAQRQGRVSLRRGRGGLVDNEEVHTGVRAAHLGHSTHM